MQLLSNYLSSDNRTAEVYVNNNGVYYVGFSTNAKVVFWKTYVDLDVAEDQAEDWVQGELSES